MENKAIIEIVGGLGNQFFIYITAKKISEKKGYFLKFDPYYYTWWPRRKNFARTFDLNKFYINIDIATEKEIRKLLWRTNNRLINSFLKKYRYFSKKFMMPSEALNKKKIKGDIYISGFEIDLNYIEKNADQIKKEFSLKKEYKNKINSILNKIKENNSVSINIRRGDLTEFKDANILPIYYYKKAIKLIEKKVKYPKFYVFSDDIDWCGKNFNFLNNTEFIKGHKVYEDLELMKNCKHNILANSSLSWWAGFLNPNKDKIVIIPKRFYHRESHKDNRVSNIFPKKWIKI